MSVTLLTLLGLCFLLGFFLLSSLVQAMKRIGIQFRDPNAPIGLERLIFFRPIAGMAFNKHAFEGAHFSAMCTLNLFRFFFAATAIAWLWSFHYTTTIIVLLLLGLFALSFLIGDYFPRMIGVRYPRFVMRIVAPPASLLMLGAAPISIPLFHICRLWFSITHLEPFDMPSNQAGREILELIQDMNVETSLEARDKELIESVVDFRSRIAREVMVPRVDVFALPASTTIREASRRLDAEGYSRIPIYEENIDDVRGILLYKDLIKKYMEFEETGDTKILDCSIQNLVKPPLYTPETKKLSQLLQEFRQKQSHLAIVVDEYGGTEGIITIEDILEQIVGDIADEYDDEEEAEFVIKPEGGWVVDAQMNLLDIEEKLGIQIPQEGDYDTIAGFIFHCAGSIPPKGFVLHRDQFELEVLSSNDRMVEKVWIKPSNTV